MRSRSGRWFGDVPAARTRRSTRRRATPRRRGSPRTPGRAGHRRRGATSPRSRSAAEPASIAVEEVVVVPRAAVLGDELRPGHAADCRARSPRRPQTRGAGLGEAACELAQEVRARKLGSVSTSARKSSRGIETQRTGVVARTRATRAPSSTSRASSPKKSPGPSSSAARAQLDGDGSVAEHEHAGARIPGEREHLARRRPRARPRGRRRAARPTSRHARERGKAAQLVDIHGTCLLPVRLPRARARHHASRSDGEDRERGDLRD